MALHEQFVRFSLSLDKEGNIEIFSCVTKTKLILPVEDVNLLIENLKSVDQMSLSLDTVCLDHFS